MAVAWRVFSLLRIDCYESWKTVATSFHCVEAVEYSRHEDGVHPDLELSLVHVKTIVAITLKTKNHWYCCCWREISTPSWSSFSPNFYPNFCPNSYAWSFPVNSASICLFSLSEEPRDCYIGTVTVAWRIFSSLNCCYEWYSMELPCFLLSICSCALKIKL